MPKTHEGLKEWVIKNHEKEDYLIMTDVAEDVKNIILGALFLDTLNQFGHL